MAIHLNPNQEHRVAEALRSGAYHSPDDVIDRALDVLHEQDEWLMANRQRLTPTSVRASKNWNAAKAYPKTSLMRTLNG
jgi:Arc/MetJ-type ribon-helix-helix transcriptional regulator